MRARADMAGDGRFRPFGGVLYALGDAGRGIAERWRAILFVVGAAVALYVWSMVAGAVLLLLVRQPLSLLSPLVFVEYAYYYGHIRAVQSDLSIAALVGLLPPIAVLALIFKTRRRPLHGVARFATLRDVTKAGLLKHKGIVLGRFGRRLLQYSGDSHVLVAAPTRSGKGVSIVIPNLLTWPESVVVLDMKRENWNATAGFRAAHGQACFRFDPAAADGTSHCWNPLDLVSREPGKAIEDLQRIANILFPDTPGVQPIWTRTPRFLFMGIAMYLMETGQPLSIGAVLRAGMDGDPYTTFDRIIKERVKAGTPLSDPCVRSLGAYLDIAAKETRAGIITGFRSALELWQSPSVDAATSRSDFDLLDLRRKRMSVYFVCAPRDLARLHPLLLLFFQLTIDVNTVTLPQFDASLKFKCMLLMDEFASIGKIESLAKGIAFVAGYGLRLVAILQSPAQIAEIYGQAAAATFLANFGVQVAHAPKRTETQTLRDVSEWLGYNTEKGINRSRTNNLFEKAKHSLSEQEQRRALLLPQEIAEIGDRRNIVIVENCPPILGRKIRYYAEKLFRERSAHYATPPAAPAIVPVSYAAGTSYAPEVFFGEPDPQDVESILEAGLEKFGIDLNGYIARTDPEGVMEFIERFTHDLATPQNAVIASA